METPVAVESLEKRKPKSYRPKKSGGFKFRFPKIKPMKMLGQPRISSENKREWTATAIEVGADVLLHRSEPLVDLAKAEAEWILKKARKKTYKTHDSAASAVEEPLATKIASALKWAATTGADAVANAAEKTKSAAEAVAAFPKYEFENRLHSALTPLDHAFESGTTIDTPKAMLVDFDSSAPQVTNYLASHKVGLMRQISNAQMDTIHGIVQRAISSGQPPAQIANQIKTGGLGLTDFQAQNVENYRKELEDLTPENVQNIWARSLRDKRYDAAIQHALYSGRKTLSPDQVDSMVGAYASRAIALRAQTIARTESMKAVNGGAYAAAKDIADRNGYTVVKKWDATHDSKTRPTHRALDGTSVVGLNTPFVTFKGNKLLYPHDPSGAADEVINCRCNANYSYQ